MRFFYLVPYAGIGPHNPELIDPNTFLYGY